MIKHFSSDKIGDCDSFEYCLSAEDRTLTIDVNPAEYSYIPHPQKEENKRMERSAVYDTNSYYNYPESSNPENTNTSLTYGTDNLGFNGQEQLATAGYGQDNYDRTSADTNSYYYGTRQSADNNTSANNTAYTPQYYSPQQYNASISYNATDLSTLAENQSQYGAQSALSAYSNDSNVLKENAYSTQQDAQNQTNLSNGSSNYSISQWDNTKNSSSYLSNDTQLTDQQSAGYTYTEQALAPAQTPSSAPAPYPAYAPYPGPYPAPYPPPYPAPYSSPYPTPAYAPYPAPYPAYAPYPYPSPAPYSPYPAPAPAPAEEKYENSE